MEIGWFDGVVPQICCGVLIKRVVDVTRRMEVWSLVCSLSRLRLRGKCRLRKRLEVLNILSGGHVLIAVRKLDELFTTCGEYECLQLTGRAVN